MLKENLSIANGITSFRLVGSVVLIFLQPLSIPFFVIYSLCGLSDVLDGTVARMTGRTTVFGSRLDSVSDLLFYGVMLFKVFPVLWKRLSGWVFVAAGIVLLLRTVTYITAAAKFRQFASVHTYLNKLTGAAVFAIPYFLKTGFATAVCIAVCVIGGLASLEELLIHLSTDAYASDVHTVFDGRSRQKEAS